MPTSDLPTTEHLESVSDQVETHRADEQETGPDPIIEAINALDLPQLPASEVPEVVGDLDTHPVGTPDEVYEDKDDDQSDESEEPKE